MEITEVRIKLMESSEDRLRGFCSVTFDGCFVVRDLKIIDGNSGPFVAMPSRKLTSNCTKCRTKNHMRANYCNQCGQKLRHARPQQGPDGRAKLYADIAHPINAGCREMIQNRVIEELRKEQALAREPGYRSRYDETYDSGPEVSSEEIKQDQQNANPRTAKPKGNADQETRADASHETPPAPHATDESSSSTTANSNNSSDEPIVKDDFGKGIFD
jgi:stage V sporulation protein G